MRWRAWLRIALCSAAVLGALATFAPLLPVDRWEVRVLAFPRLQFAVALAPILIGLLLLPITRGSGVAAALAASALGMNIFILSPYGPLVARATEDGRSCPPESSLRLLVANVQMKNRESDRLIAMVREADPDVALFLETDAWWNEEIGRLRAEYPHELRQLQQNYYGMYLLSRRELVSGDIRPGPGDLPPSLVAGIRLPAGQLVRLYGLHPRPPRPGQSAKQRDAEILGAAERARDDQVPSVIAGDLNAVPWERVIETAIRIAGLRDPRIGRGFLATWLAESDVVRWPIDHILPDAKLDVVEFKVLPPFGSDHLAVLAVLCVPSPRPGGVLP